MYKVRASVPMYVDDEDFELLNYRTKHRRLKYRKKRRWHLYHDNYPRATISKKQVIAHSLLINCPKGKVIDHIDGNPLNNQKSNLRVCTYSQNAMNRIRSKDNTSGYKGVYLDKAKNKWRARIMKEGKRISLGSFDSSKDAYRVYKNAAKELHGEFARW
tara:strand:+ start:6896 stop:7372 length:477 start_codon:yes stop_codon:yes gene_type:complete